MGGYKCKNHQVGGGVSGDILPSEVLKNFLHSVLLQALLPIRQTFVACRRRGIHHTTPSPRPNLLLRTMLGTPQIKMPLAQFRDWVPTTHLVQEQQSLHERLWVSFPQTRQVVSSLDWMRSFVSQLESCLVGKQTSLHSRWVVHC